MDKTKLYDWIQIVGIFAVVASLIFVGIQLKQDRAIATAEALASRSEAVTELATLIGENKALWVSGLNGEELSEEDQAAFQAMAEAVESYFVALYVRIDAISASTGVLTSEDPITNYAFALYLNEGLRRVWDTQRDYWKFRDSAIGSDDGGNFLRQRVDTELARLIKDDPPKPDKKRYVFW